jgi:hypothetical protein
MACYLASLGVPSLWEQFLKLVALIGGGFPGVFALGLLTKRVTATGVMIGAVASIGVTGWVQSCTGTSPFFHGFMAIGYLASLFIGRRKDPATLRGLVIWDLPAAKAPAAQR